MAIDARIALGVQPIEQPNMLAQMGQMMQLRQAQQGYESENALKDFYAQGGDLSKPEDQRRLMSTVGAKGADLIAKQFALQKTKEEVKKLGYDNVESEFKQSRGLLSSIDPDSPNAGPQLMAWHEANHRSPIMGSILAASGISAESSRATLQASIAKGPAGIREAIRRSSLGQADYQKELMQTERSVIAAGPGNRQAAVAEQGTFSPLIVGRRVFQTNSRTGEVREAQDPYDNTSGTVTVGPITNLPDTSTSGGVVTSGASGASVPTKPNMLPEIVGATPSVNNLRNPPVAANAPVLKTRPPVTNPLMVEEKPVWNEKAGVFMYPPSEDNPKGRVVEVPAIQEAVQKRAANQTLKLSGFDPKTGTNEISELIKKSTGGLFENLGDKLASAVFSYGTEGAQAIAALETRANELTLGLAPNGSLGAGFSNDDRLFMLGKLGDVANPNKPVSVRLAAWEDVLGRAARTAGVPYPTSSASGTVTPSTALPKGFKLD
jgi:hypothetical protein